jgi:hypothetical protein
MYISKSLRDAFSEKIDAINELMSHTVMKIVMKIENNPENSDQFRIALAGGVSEWISRSELEDRTDNILLALRNGTIEL